MLMPLMWEKKHLTDCGLCEDGPDVSSVISLGSQADMLLI